MSAWHKPTTLANAGAALAELLDALREALASNDMVGARAILFGDAPGPVPHQVRLEAAEAIAHGMPQKYDPHPVVRQSFAQLCFVHGHHDLLRQVARGVQPGAFRGPDAPLEGDALVAWQKARWFRLICTAVHTAGRDAVGVSKPVDLASIAQNNFTREYAADFVAIVLEFQPDNPTVALATAVAVPGMDSPPPWLAAGRAAQRALWMRDALDARPAAAADASVAAAAPERKRLRRDI